MTVNVLGVTYEIKESNKVEDIQLIDNDGYCDVTTKTIVIDTFQDQPGTVADLQAYRKRVIRHELVHAFLHESGLDANSWASDEEIVDWIALQFPKLSEVFRKAEAL